MPLLVAVIPAVLAGNSVILKMSPRTPLTAVSAFQKAFEAAGAPANLVTSLDCSNDVAASVRAWLRACVRGNVCNCSCAYSALFTTSRIVVHTFLIRANQFML